MKNVLGVSLSTIDDNIVVQLRNFYEFHLVFSNKVSRRPKCASEINETNKLTSKKMQLFFFPLYSILL